MCAPGSGADAPAQLSWAQSVLLPRSLRVTPMDCASFFGSVVGERDFVRYANTSYRDAYIQAFLPANGVLEWQGPLEGGACAHCVHERASERSHSMSLKPTHVSP